MTLSEKYFALLATPCFSHLHESELTLIADIAHEREYAPGESFCVADQVLKRFYIVIRGGIVDPAGERMPSVLGPASLLLDLPARAALQADPKTGATCLVIGKGHFFTIVFQCPSVISRLLEADHLEAGAAPAGEVAS